MARPRENPIPKKKRWTRPTGFGAALKAIRDEKGLTQAQLAERINTAEGRDAVTVRTLSRLEIGENDPQWSLALALAEALGVDVGAFAPDRPTKSRKAKT